MTHVTENDPKKYLAIHKDVLWMLIEDTRKRALGIIDQLVRLEKATEASEWVPIEHAD